MSDIQPGDLVVCVDDGAIHCARFIHTGTAVSKGRLYRVAGIRPSRNVAGEECDCRSIYTDSPTGAAGLIQRFRKLNDEPDNIELIERIKSYRPVKTGVPA